jgi:hypothetical protein
MEKICTTTPLSHVQCNVNEIKTINDHSQRVSLIRPKLPHPNISNPNSTIDWPDLKLIITN